MNYYKTTNYFFHLLILLLFRNSFCYLIYPFKTRKYNIKENEPDITLLFRSLIHNNLFINLEIGEPKQTIDAFLRLDKSEFYLSEKTKLDVNTISPMPYIPDVDSSLDNFYDKNKSRSINITSKSGTDFNHKGKYIIENFYFNNNKIKFNTVLYNSTYGNMPCVIGLKYVPGETSNFLSQLDLNEVINSLFWMVNYTSDYEGNIIVGGLPHEVDPHNFKEDDLYYSHPFIYKTMTSIGLRFSEIIFNETFFRPYLECFFHYENNYIGGIKYFENELDKYFNESIKNGSCFKVKVKYNYGPYRFFYCDKEKYQNNIKYFPPLRFELKEINYTFELNYNDLFVEKNNKLILMVFFDSYMDWSLGKPFLLKYQFVINEETKLIGFYKKSQSKIIPKEGENNSDDEKNNSNKLVLMIILIIVVVFVLFFIGILIGKYLCKNKDKKKNKDYDDDYDYEAKTDETIYPWKKES
jgi:hypothetical protein